MSVKHLGEYAFEPANRVENYGGAINLYIVWDGHLLFVCPLALPVDPATRFREFLTQVVQPCYRAHPDAADLDWDRVEWTYENKPWTPNLDQSLAENGVRHMSFLRFRSPATGRLATRGL
jgi:phenol hydroxylase P4 protein